MWLDEPTVTFVGGILGICDTYTVMDKPHPLPSTRSVMGQTHIITIMMDRSANTHTIPEHGVCFYHTTVYMV